MEDLKKDVSQVNSFAGVMWNGSKQGVKLPWRRRYELGHWWLHRTAGRVV